MSIRVKLLSAAGALVLAGTVAGVAGTAGAAAPPPIDVSNSTVRCNTIDGVLKFTVPLHVGGTTPNTITPATHLYDCSSSTPGVSLKLGVGTGTLFSSTNDCAGLQGLSTGTSGTLNVDWAVNAGAAKLLPTTLVGTALKMRTVFNINQTFGSTNAPFATEPGATYGYFQVGTDAAHGSTAAPSVTAEFTGGDGGASMTLDVETVNSGGKILVDCFSTGGIKVLKIGAGTVGNQ